MKYQADPRRETPYGVGIAICGSPCMQVTKKGLERVWGFEKGMGSRVLALGRVQERFLFLFLDVMRCKVRRF